MKVSQHCRLTSKIAVMILVSSVVLPSGWGDENKTKAAPREVAMVAASKGLESLSEPIQPAIAVIEQVKTMGLGQHVEVRVIASGALSCAPFRLSNPDRLVLDCSGSRVQFKSTPSRVDLDPVRSVRVGQFKSDVARVVIDLEGQPTYNVRPDGNTVIITFDSTHPRLSGLESKSKPMETAPTPVNLQNERAPSTPPPTVPDSSTVEKHTEVTSNSPISADASLSNKPGLTPAAQGPPASVSSDTGALQETDAEPNTPGEKIDSTAADADYVIGDQDVLAINVWREPELSRSVPVRPDGKISLPLVGDIRVRGLTPRMLQARLTEELDSYIRKPQVTVIIQEVNSRKFYIIGQVEKPGTYPLASHVAVLDALAMSGGFRDFAKVQHIYLLRLMPDGSRKRISFDYKAAVNGKDTYRDVEIQTDDTLVVP
jgi:polysaccharide export outer membrane protein